MAEFLTVAQVAEKLQVADATVRRWVRTGLIEVTRLPSGGIRIPADTIDALSAGRVSRLPSSSAVPKRDSLPRTSTRAIGGER